MEDTIREFRNVVSRFCNHLESSSAALLQSVNRRPIPFESASLSFVEGLNRRVSTATSDLKLLESMTCDTVSFEELLGHCNEIYKQNQNDIAEIEERISVYGYAAELEISEPEEDLDDLQPNTTLHLKNTIEDDSLFDDTLSLEKLGISDISLASIVSEGNNKREMDQLLDTNMDISKVEMDKQNASKPFEDVSINVLKDAYDGLPSYMKSLASWEDLLVAVEKLNLRLKQKTKKGNFFTQDEVSSLELESASLSFVEGLNRRVSTATSDLNLLESMTCDTVSFEELLGHCNEIYKKNQNDIAEIEEQLSVYGYVAEISEPEEDLDQLNTTLDLKNTIEDDYLFDDTLSLEKLGIPDVFLASIVSEGNNKREIDQLLDTNMDMKKVEMDEQNESKQFEDVSINVLKDAYDSLPSYMKSLASWEDLVVAVEKLNLRLKQKTKKSNFFTQDEVSSLELGPKTRSYLLLLVKMNRLVVETIDGFISYRVL